MARDAAFGCVYCLASDCEQMIDHVIPQHDGGSDDAANVVVSCSRCNDAKHMMALDLFAIYLERRGRGAAADIIARVQHQLSLSRTAQQEKK